MRNKSILILAVITLALAGCKSLGPFFAKPDVTFDHMAIGNVSLFESTLLLTFKIHNPNPMGVNVEAITYNLAIENNLFAKGTSEAGIRLPAAGSGNVTIPVTINHQEIFRSLPNLMTRDAVKYNISGKFRVLGFDLPFQRDGNLNLPKFPRIAVETIEVKGISFSGAALEFILSMQNPNDFAVDPDSIEYALSLGGVPFVTGEALKIPSAAPNSGIRLRVPATIDFLGMGRSAMQLLDRQSARYDLSGTMRFNRPGKGATAIPFSQSGEVPLVR